MSGMNTDYLRTAPHKIQNVSPYKAVQLSAANQIVEKRKMPGKGHVKKKSEITEGSAGQ
jgi:hypothetical protein